MSPSVLSTTAFAIALPLTYVTWYLSGRYLYAYFSRRCTVLYEINDLGKARSEAGRIKGTALIIGGRSVTSRSRNIKTIISPTILVLLGCGPRVSLLITSKRCSLSNLRFGYQTSGKPIGTMQKATSHLKKRLLRVLVSLNILLFIVSWFIVDDIVDDIVEPSYYIIPITDIQTISYHALKKYFPTFNQEVEEADGR